MRIVVVSDAHLDARTAGVERFDEIRESFDQAVMVAIEGEKGTTPADLFVFCGDLCDAEDGRDVLRASAYLVDVAVRLTTHGVKSLFLAGNHDICEDGKTTTLEPLWGLERLYDVEDSSGDKGLRVAPVVASYGPRCFNFQGHVVLALPYSPKPYDAEADLIGAGALKTPLLVFSHLMLPNMHPGSESGELARGKDRNFPLEAMKKVKPKLVVQGHYHQRQVTQDGIQVVGSLARLTFSEEAHEPGYLVIDL